DAEMLAAMVDLVDLVLVEEAARFLVADEGVVLPAVPEGLHHLHMLAGALIALGMGQLLVEVEVAGRVVTGGGHHVPAGASVGNVIERGELAGQVERLFIGRRGRGDEADMLRKRSEERRAGKGWSSTW